MEVEKLQEMNLQEQRVTNAAGVVKQYLDLHKSKTIERNNFSVNFDPNSKVLTYKDKIDPSNSFQAEYKQKKWVGIKGKFHLSAESDRYFQNVDRNIKRYLQPKKSLSRRR